jgi:hypothetical protein
MTRRPGLSVVAIAAAMLCGSFSGSKAETEQAQAQPAKPAQKPPQPRKKNDACAFVPRSLIEGFAKEELFLFHVREEENMTVCEVISPKTKTTFVTVKVYWAGGKEVAQTNEGAMSMAKPMLNDKDTDIQKRTGSSKVRGLADKAFCSDVMPSWFLKGDVLVELVSPLFPAEQTSRLQGDRETGTPPAPGAATNSGRASAGISLR